MIEVPNFDMILQKNLFSEFIADHLFYFTQDTLETTLRLNGFEVIEMTTVWHDYIISAVVRKRPCLDISHFEETRAEIKKGVFDFIHSHGSKKIAVWGAGHQALAVMSLIDLAPHVKYVVDSAPFKQNKFTPATHLPIVAPDQLNSDLVESLIIMAASYSDEIVKIVQTQFPHVKHIAILREFGLEIVN